MNVFPYFEFAEALTPLFNTKPMLAWQSPRFLAHLERPVLSPRCLPDMAEPHTEPLEISITLASVRFGKLSG